MRTWLIRCAWLALAAVAGLTSWLVIANRGAAPPARAPTVPTPLSDYSLDTATITRYAPSGSRRYVLHSKRIIHWRAPALSFLSPVELDYYPDSGSYWHLSAKHGRLSHSGNRIALKGKVLARQPEAAVPLHLATSRLKLRLHARRIHSTAPVRLWQGNRNTRGIGLQADLDRGVVKILHDVTSRYVD